MTKTGLVLGGGGARGSYEVGVWEALDELSIKPDIVTGTSVGALNGALIAQGDLEEAKRLWLSVDNAKILGTDFSTRLGTNPVANISAFAREFVEHGGADASGLLALLNQNISEERVRSSPDTLFGLVTVRFPSMKPEKLFIDEIPEGKLNHYLMASSAFFPAMRAYEMDGKAFVDGGYNDNMPAKMAIDRGADQIIAVNLEAPGIVRRMGSLRSVKTGEVSVTEIKCRQHLGEILNFDSETAGRNIRFGYLDTMKAFHRLDGCRYSFSRTGGTLLELSLLAEREILHAGLDEKGNRSLRFSLARGISKDVGRERLTPLSCTMHAIDCAAHVYGADPLKIYTYDEICSFIVTEYKKSGPDPLKSISLYKTLEKNQAKTSGFAAHRLMTLSRRDVVAAFVETLRTARAKREFKRMHLAARFFPAELEAAILINCLTGKNKESTYEQN